MSYHYMVMPVSKELLEWGRKCDVPISLDTPDGRSPTAADVARVLDSPDGFISSVQGTDDDLHAQVDSIEMVEWEYQSSNPLLNKAFGGIRTSPKESVTIDGLHAKGQSPALAFHGNITLIVRIARELVQYCGPLAAFATCDGIPAFFLPDAETPVWNKSWV